MLAKLLEYLFGPPTLMVPPGTDPLKFPYTANKTKWGCVIPLALALAAGMAYLIMGGGYAYQTLRPKTPTPTPLPPTAMPTATVPTSLPPSPTVTYSHATATETPTLLPTATLPETNTPSPTLAPPTATIADTATPELAQRVQTETPLPPTPTDMLLPPTATVPTLDCTAGISTEIGYPFQVTLPGAQIGEAAYLADGDPLTWLGAENPAVMILDLGERLALAGLRLYAPVARITPGVVQIDLSPDEGQTWFQSCALSTQPGTWAEVGFSVEARLIRLSTSAARLALAEVEVRGRP